MSTSAAKRLVMGWRGGGGGGVSGSHRKQSHESGRLVGGTTGGDHELDEIAVVSVGEHCQLKYGSGGMLSVSANCNGPRIVPGIITSSGPIATSGGGCGASVVVDHRMCGSSGSRLDVISSTGSTHYGNAPTASADSLHRRLCNSMSGHSLLDLVGCKLGMSRHSRHQQHQQSYQHEGYYSSSRDSIAYINRAAASELDLSRKGRGNRRKDLRGGPGAGGTAGGRLRSTASAVGSGEAPLLGGWQRVGGQSGDRRGGPGRDFDRSHENHLGSMTGSYNGTESRYGFRRIDSYSSRIRVGSHNWSFVFDPAGRLCYYWSMVVSLAFLYNFWVIIYRFAFREIDSNTIVVWFCLDYFADFLYLVDILFHFRTGYLEDGVLQTDSGKLRQHYMNSTTFYIDCLCLLPLDFLYLSIGFNSILRSFRLVKIYRFWAFMDRTERHTNYPNLFRSSSLIHYLLVIFHWNGCLFHIILKNDGFGSKNWVYSDSESTDYVKAYLQSYYWCTLALTTIGDLPRPRNKGEYLFVIFQLLFGLLLFATVLGHVANIVTSVSTARKEFQATMSNWFGLSGGSTCILAIFSFMLNSEISLGYDFRNVPSVLAKLDGVKTYMRMRRVPNHLQVKVIKWFDYLWLTQKCSDEEKAVSCLPDKLKAEIAINVHLDTLKRVEIFQNTEAGFLCELVLRLRPVLFSPGDYICRKGEVGKEMYIVNRGRLQVVADNGRTVLATLKAGSYFGEISILNMGTAGNRRTASVRSVGYSDLFVLSKKDMWDVLKEYPAARVRLEAIAVKRLEKYKRAPLEKAAMGRSQSTPGLVESRGRIKLEDMWVPPYPPILLMQPQSLQSQSLQPSQGPPPPSAAVTPDSPGAASTSSGRSHQHHLQENRSGTILQCDSMTQLMSGVTTPILGSHDVLESEIKRLRERLHTVEAENAAMSVKLHQQQWELEHRLAEIELQICRSGATSQAGGIDGRSRSSSSVAGEEEDDILNEEEEPEDDERNRESII